jgi:hypothetical protein
MIVVLVAVSLGNKSMPRGVTGIGTCAQLSRITIAHRCWHSGPLGKIPALSQLTKCGSKTDSDSVQVRKAGVVQY